MVQINGVFDDLRNTAWPIEFSGTLRVHAIAGGVPSDPRVIEGWLRSKIDPDARDKGIQQLVADTMVERELSAEEALTEVQKSANVNGFMRDPEKGLYIEGRQLKAAIKEAASVAMGSGKIDSRGWGRTNKGLKNYLAEHVVVMEENLYLGRMEPDGIVQRFVHVYSGDSIKYEEYVKDVDIDFTVVTDHDFKREDWGQIWLTGEYQGLGASRSQGFGRYTVTRWERVR